MLLKNGPFLATRNSYQIAYLEITVDPRLSGSLDYPNFFFLKSWSRSVVVFFFKTAGLKSEAKASLFRFQKAKAALVRVLTKEEPSNEVGLT